MYVVQGATGHTGSVVAKSLLEKGEKVRVVGRDAYKLAQLSKLGAASVTADASDATALTQAFAGARPLTCCCRRARKSRSCWLLARR
jgi:uncharacterized protein YbjT (DUF2867 family)